MLWAAGLAKRYGRSYCGEHHKWPRLRWNWKLRRKNTQALAGTYAKGLRYSSIVCKSRVSYFSIYVRPKVESKPVGSLQPRVRSCPVILMKHQVINSVERRIVATSVTGAREAYLSLTILSVLVNAAPEITLQTARNRHYQCSSKYKTETSMYASIHAQSERKPQTSNRDWLRMCACKELKI